MNRDRRSQKRVVVYRAEVPHETQAYEVVYESVADALHFACRDLATERRRPLAIIEDGILVLDADQIVAECEERRDGPGAPAGDENSADRSSAASGNE